MTDSDVQYGRVIEMLGDRRVLCFCDSDGKVRVCKIRGSLTYKGMYIAVGDIVLLSPRLQQNVWDLIAKVPEDDWDSIIYAEHHPLLLPRTK